MKKLKRFLKKKLKPLPPCPEKPIELKGEAASLDCGVALVYTGNGAAAHHYERVLAETGMRFRIYEGLGGKADICVVIYMDEDSGPPVLLNAFEHDEAVFTGFTLRKKINDQWHWMCIDGLWHPVSQDMPEKKLYPDSCIAEIPAEDLSGVLIFEAAWQLEDGTSADSGYLLFNNRLLAHALGAMNGKAYHNTMAAYENAMTKGYSYYEVDLSMTTDGRMVLCHGWTESNCRHTGFEYSDDLDKTMTYRKLMGMKVHGNPLIDLRSFYKVMKDHSDHLYEFDLHPVKGKKAVAIAEEIIRDCKNDRQVLDRVLMQVYSKKMYQAIDRVYHFRYYQHLIGKPETKLYDVIPFLIDEGICAAAIPARKAAPEYVKPLRNAGIYVLAYTVESDASAAQKLLDMGINTVCTDYVTPADLV